MKFYRKQLRSTTDLQKEKARLQQQCAQMEKEALSDVKNLKVPDLLPVFKSTTSGSSDQNILVSLLGGIAPGAGPLLNILESLLPQMGGGIQEKIKKRATSLATGAAKEVIGGYLKWKAVELGFKGVRYLIQTRKKKKKEAKAAKTDL